MTEMLVTTSEAMNEIAAALSKFQGELENVTKDNRADIPGKYSYTYADLASVLDAVRGPMARNGLSMVQVPLGGKQEITVATLLLHTSGQWIRGDLMMCPADNRPQSIGSAITYARRYAASAMLGIAAEDDDGAAAQYGTKQPPKKQPAPPAPSEHPQMANEQQQKDLGDLARECGWSVAEASRRMKALVGVAHRQELTFEQARTVIGSWVIAAKEKGASAS